MTSSANAPSTAATSVHTAPSGSCVSTTKPVQPLATSATMSMGIHMFSSPRLLSPTRSVVHAASWVSPRYLRAAASVRPAAMAACRAEAVARSRCASGGRRGAPPVGPAGKLRGPGCPGPLNMLQPPYRPWPVCTVRGRGTNTNSTKYGKQVFTNSPSDDVPPRGC